MSPIKLFGAALLGLLALASAAAAVGLFVLGSANNWTSDGPALLIAYLGIPFFALVTLGLGWAAFRILTHNS